MHACIHHIGTATKGVSSLHIHACIHTCMHTYIHTYMHTYMHTYIHTYIHTYMHAYMHAYIHTYIHTYMDVYTKRDIENSCAASRLIAIENTFYSYREHIL